MEDKVKITVDTMDTMDRPRGIRLCGWQDSGCIVIRPWIPCLVLYKSVEKGRNLYRTCISSYMKRVNPDTNQPFKYGDKRADGMVFYNYRSDVLLTGFHGERWLTPEKFALAESRDRFLKHKKRRQDGKPTRMTRGKVERLRVKEAHV